MREVLKHESYVQIRIVCAPKIAFIYISINLNMCFGAQKNRLIETVLLSTHNICLGYEIRKIIYQYALLSGDMMTASIFIIVCTDMLRQSTIRF